MNINKVLLGISAFILSVAFLGCATVDNTDPNDLTTTTTSGAKEVIKIGYMGPLTGDIASIGEAEKRAVELAFAGRNKYEVIYEDSRCDGQAAANAAQKLINIDKVKVIMGAGCSGASLAATPIANDNNVILFSSLSTSPELTEAGGEYFFRNAPSDEKASDVLAELMASKKVAIISENTDFGQAYRETLKTKLETQGATVVLDEVFNPGTTDFKTVLQKVSESEAEAIANLANSSVAAGLIAKQAKELAVQLPMYGTDVFSGTEFIETALDAAEGAISVMVAANTTDQRVVDLFNEYQDTYGEEPAASAYVALSYDRANILLEAIDNVGYDTDKIRDYLFQLEFNGLGGQTSFDENGDSTLLPLTLVVKDGELVPLQ